MGSRDGRGGLWRSRWAAIGAAVAVTFGAGGLVAVNAAGGVDSTTVMTDPVRVLDSRDPVNVGLTGPFASRAPQKLQITGPVPTTSGIQTAVPTGATGVLLNVTAVKPQADGFISIRPGDAVGQPATSSLNVSAGQILPNAVVVALPVGGPNDGEIDITYDAYGQTGPTTDILIDVVGYTNNSTLAALQAQVDSKAPRTKTVTMSGFDGTALQGVVLNAINGCARNTVNGNLQLYLPVPVGAAITNVTATLYDAAGTSQLYDVRLRRATTLAAGDSYETLTSASGGELNVRTVTKDLTPASETVDPGERFWVDFAQLSGNLNGLCAASITYQESSTSAPLAADSPELVGDLVCDDPDSCIIQTP